MHEARRGNGQACKAASVCMRQEGATDSIPRQEEATEEAVVIPGLF